MNTYLTENERRILEGARIGIAPHSPRVGIAAAMEANTVIAWLLDRPV